MPKMKTKRSAAKRYKLTASGKIKVKRPGLRHNLSKKSTSRKRGYRAPTYVHPSDLLQAKRCLPYS